MLWLANGITELILNIMSAILGVLSWIFLKDIRFDIGAPIRSGNLVKALNGIGEFDDGHNVLLSPFLKTSNTSVFDSVFGKYAEGYMGIIMMTSIIISLLIFMFKLLQIMTSSDADTGSPVRLVARFLVGTFLIVSAYELFVMVEFGFDQILQNFQRADFLAGVDTGWNLLDDLEPDGSRFSAIDSFLSLGENILSIVIPGGKIAGVVALVINIAIVGAILTNFIKLVLEVVERYVLLGVLFYTAPLGFATFVDKNSRVTANWISMVGSHFVVMLSSYFFLSIGILAIGSQDFSIIYESYSAYLLYMLMIVGWFLLGTKFDAILKGLGLSTAQTGANLAGAVVGTMAAFRGAESIGKAIGSKNENGQHSTTLGKGIDRISDFFGKFSVGDRMVRGAGGGGGTASTPNSAQASPGMGSVSKAGERSVRNEAAVMSEAGIPLTNAHKSLNGANMSAMRNLDGKADMAVFDDGKGVLAVGKGVDKLAEDLGVKPGKIQNKNGEEVSALYFGDKGDKLGPAGYFASDIQKMAGNNIANGNMMKDLRGVDISTGDEFDIDIKKPIGSMNGGAGQTVAIAELNGQDGYLIMGRPLEKGPMNHGGVPAFNRDAIETAHNLQNEGVIGPEGFKGLKFGHSASIENIKENPDGAESAYWIEKGAFEELQSAKVKNENGIVSTPFQGKDAGEVFNNPEYEAKAAEDFKSFKHPAAQGVENGGIYSGMSADEGRAALDSYAETITSSESKQEATFGPKSTVGMSDAVTTSSGETTVVESGGGAQEIRHTDSSSSGGFEIDEGGASPHGSGAGMSEDINHAQDSATYTPDNAQASSPVNGFEMNNAQPQAQPFETGDTQTSGIDRIFGGSAITEQTTLKSESKNASEGVVVASVENEEDHVVDENHKSKKRIFGKKGKKDKGSKSKK